jgi:hypothetical protein
VIYVSLSRKFKTSELSWSFLRKRGGYKTDVDLNLYSALLLLKYLEASVSLSNPPLSHSLWNFDLYLFTAFMDEFSNATVLIYLANVNQFYMWLVVQFLRPCLGLVD